MKKKKFMFFITTIFLLFTIIGCNRQSIKSSSNQPSIETLSRWSSSFWYNSPAKHWTEALPLGNGRIGAMVFGGIGNEEILINENSIWAGPPTPIDNLEGPKIISQMRELIFQGKYFEANEICKNELLHPEINPRSYQPLGYINIDYGLSEDVKNYKRLLDYGNSVAKVSFEQDGVIYLREAFVSKPDQVFGYRIKSNKSGKVSLNVGLNRESDFISEVLSTDQIHISGQAQHDGKHQGVGFDGLLKVINSGGKIYSKGNRIHVDAADEVILLFTCATDYNFKDPLNALKSDRLSKCISEMENASSVTYDLLKSTHVDDYVKLFGRSTLEIDHLPKVEKPIDERIASVKKGIPDPELLMIYYEYCRYLLISASREGGIPLNLQGVWNPLMEAPWNSDYHINANIEMAYWFAEQGNLAECHEPLFSLTEGLLKNGQATVRDMLGCRRGFMATYTTDLWMFTTPSGLPLYGMYTGGGAWMSSHMMEHFRFTQDKNFLRDRAYNILRNNALFYLEWLFNDPVTQKLVAGPGASAENEFRDSQGNICAVTMGSAQDQEFAWNAFRDFLEASAILEVDNDEVAEVRNCLENLALPKIATDGRLMEWNEEFEEVEPGHRHLSHLWGFMPGNRITMEHTPELVSAVEKSLNYRLTHNYSVQGWSLGWVVNILARLKQGDRAYEMMSSEYFKQTYPNMFVKAHDQVQVGDMMGVPLGVIQLLLQCHTGKIEVLPSLPVDWKSGFVKGLCARGGFVVDISWENSILKEVKIHSKKGGLCTIIYKGKEFKIQTKESGNYIIEGSKI
jgi:alpha-L-fucosidase 2